MDKNQRDFFNLEQKFTNAIESEIIARKEYEAKTVRNLEEKY